MKKEQAVLGFIAVAVIGFAVGRMTAPGAGTGPSPTGEVAKDTSSAKGSFKEHGSLTVKGAPFKGPEVAKVTIAEFSDFQ